MESARKVMVVDDDESVTSFVSFCLKNEGHDVSVCHTASRAVNMVSSFKPDLILLDIMLPGGDGFSVCEQLKKQPDSKDTPIIFITAYADDGKLEEAKKVGAQGFIEKPLTAGSLALQVSEAFSGRFTMPTRLKYKSA